jgi:WXG100 family type VII secretion target
MKIVPKDLEDTGKEFHEASLQTQAIRSHLEEVVCNLEKNWSDANKQRFYEHYKEWNQHMVGFSVILDSIAEELEAIADRYKEAGKVYPYHNIIRGK